MRGNETCYKKYDIFFSIERFIDYEFDLQHLHLYYFLKLDYASTFHLNYMKLRVNLIQMRGRRGEGF